RNNFLCTVIKTNSRSALKRHAHHITFISCFLIAAPHNHFYFCGGCSLCGFSASAHPEGHFVVPFSFLCCHHFMCITGSHIGFPGFLHGHGIHWGFGSNGLFGCHTVNCYGIVAFHRFFCFIF